MIQRTENPILISLTARPGVGRPSLREALRALAMIDAAENRRGFGTPAKCRRSSPMSSTTSWKRVQFGAEFLRRAIALAAAKFTSGQGPGSSTSEEI
jgi:DNA-binding FadR family transcriptional regulator